MEFDYKKNLEKQKVKLVKPLNYKKIIGKAQPVNLEDPKIFEKMKTLGWRMVKSCVDGGGIGLAAPQIGIPVRAFITIEFKNPWIWKFEDNFKLYINPEYTLIRKTERTSFSEECLSVPRKSLIIKRPKALMATYWSFTKKEKLEQFQELLEGYSARAFLHERDHLEGLNIIDLYERQNKKPRRGRPKGSKNKKKRQ
jgi:peptide deformylase